MRNKLVMSVLISVVGLVLANFANAYKDYTYQTQRLEFAEAADSLLVKRGYCANSNDCRKRQYLFVSPVSEGLDVEIYGIDDYAVLSEIVNLGSAAFFKGGAAMNIRLRIYKVTKEYDLKLPFWKAREFLLIKFEGDKNAKR